MDLSIAIVSYNVRELLGECLSSVQESGRLLRQEVIVVDNASYDGSAEMVQERFPHVKLIQNSQNLGFARAANQALRVSQGRYLLLLNPDTFVIGDCLPRMVEFMDRHSGCGAATCRVWLDARREWCISNFLSTDPWREILLSTRLIGRTLTPRSVMERHWRRCWEIWNAQQPCYVETIIGAFFLVRRTVWEQVGELDERFFMYYEDNDWSRRIRQAGWKLCFHPEVGIVHHSGQSSKGIRHMLGMVGRQSQRHYLRKHFGWTRAASVRFLLASDSRLSRLLSRLRGISEDLLGPIRPGATLDLRNCPVSLSWPASRGATHYLFEVSLDQLFLGTAGRFVTSAEIALPLDELRKPGFQWIYWRAVPFCGDEPMAPWVRGRRRARTFRGHETVCNPGPLLPRS